MKIPIYNPKCPSCGKPKITWINMEDTKFYENCNCGDKTLAFIDIKLSKGEKLLIRSAHEALRNKDYSLSIVFAASAFEIDLRAYHMQWKFMQYIEENGAVPVEDPNEMFRKYYGVVKKIKNTIKIAYPDGPGKYCQLDEETKETLKGFPSLNAESIVKDIQQNLFNPRNLVLHLGKVDYTYEDSIKAYNISRFGIKMLESLDGEFKSKHINKSI